ncbi:SPOR domain-containing protein [Neobacillus sp. LXY-1]|uniref:SPOR domain-containing protein n=1 Tax=Neobacillus sp. LXY-1 TaxID=3379133 RepID=UPI003EE3DDD7
MDKPKQKGNTIRVTFNGENSGPQEEPLQKVSSDKPDSHSKVIQINKNSQDSEVYLETAATQESVDENFDWIIPESAEQDVDESHFIKQVDSKKTTHQGKFSIHHNPKKKNDKPLSKVVISAIFAIVIGTTIGYFMLKLVITESDQKASTQPNQPNQPNQTVVQTTPGTKENQNKETSKTNSTSLDPLTTYVVQGGAFGAKEGAKDATSNLSSKGISSQFLEMNGKYYVFLGTADSIEGAKALAGKFKEKGMDDLFAKQIVVEKRTFSNLTDKEKSFLETAPTIYQTLSSVTANAQISNSISEEAAKALNTINKTLNISGIKNEKVKTLKSELSNAAGKLNEYKKSKNSKSLNEAQQQLLNFLAAYYSL